MARNDPTDTGGLFIGRRPGTAPVHYASEPEMGSPGRRRLDRAIAVFVLLVETLVCLTLWGPQPVAWLWVGSQVDYHSGSVTLGIAVAFAGMIASADAHARAGGPARRDLEGRAAGGGL